MLDREAYDRQQRERALAKLRDEADELLAQASWKVAAECAHAGLTPARGAEIARAWFDNTREALKKARAEIEQEAGDGGKT